MRTNLAESAVCCHAPDGVRGGGERLWATARTAAWLLTFSGAIWASACRATAGESRPLAGQRLDNPLLVVQLAEARDQGGVPASLRPLEADGARIVLIQPDGAVRLLTRAFHSACEPDVAYDGQRFLFAGKSSETDPWNIYEMTLASGAVRQITRGLGDCRSPGYQSSHYQLSERDDTWEQITFVRVDYAAVGDAGTAPVSNLWTCKPDGSLARPITFNLRSDLEPAIMWDGRLLHASGRRVEGDPDEAGRVSLLDINTDGTDYAAFVTEAGKRIKRMPCATRQSAFFVESDSPRWDGAGSLGSVSLIRPLHSYRPVTAEGDGLYHSPSVLPDGSLLVSRRPADGSGKHAVYRLDVEAGRATLVFDDPEFHDIQAKAVVTRAEPDGRSSSVVDSDPTGKLYCLNVYAPDLGGQAVLPSGSVRRVRVVEGVLRQGAAEGPDRAAPVLRRVLGEAPVWDDGSFNIQVPANIPLELQLLDEDGLAIRTSGWVWTRNRFNQGCVGCHEDPELVPENFVVEALNRPSESLPAPPEKRRKVTFLRDVLPVVGAKCAPCHGVQGAAPELADALARGARSAFDAVCGTESGGADSVPYVDRGRARTSPLIWHILGKNTSRPWDASAVGRSFHGIPHDSAVQLTEAERQLFIEWIDLGAAFDDSGSGSLQPLAATGPPQGRRDGDARSGDED